MKETKPLKSNCMVDYVDSKEKNDGASNHSSGNKDVIQILSGRERKRKKCSGYIMRFLALVSFALVVYFCITLWRHCSRKAVCESVTQNTNSIQDMEGVLNPALDPCDDFYNFACGRWNQTVKDFNYSSVVEETEISSLLKLESLLECTSYNNDWSKFLKETYRSCMNERRASIRRSGTVSFLRSLAAPLLQDGTKELNLDETIERVQHKILQFGLFTWEINLDRNPKNNEGVQVLKVKPPERSANGKDYLPEYLERVLNLLGTKRGDIGEIAEKIIAFNTLINNQRTETFQNVKDKKIILTKKRLFYDKFCDEFKFINFSKYFEEFPLPETTVFIVEEPEYFLWLEKQLDKLGRENDPIVHYYLTWLVVDFFVPFMPAQFRAIRSKYIHRATPEGRHVFEHGHVCLHAIKTGMNFAASSLFLERTLNENSKNTINEILRYIKSSYEEFVNGLQTSHPEDGRQWTEGVQQVFDNIEIGVPKHFRKLYEQSVNFDQDDKSFASRYLHGVRFVKTSMTNYIQKVPLAALFLLDFMKPNGIFINLPYLVIHLGILHPPLFDANRHLSFNYAGFGFILAHELSHSVLFLALNTNSTLKDLKMNIECLSKQYSSDLSRVREVREEDFSDNLAIRIAYDAYLKHLATSRKNLSPNLSEKKKFFIQFSQIWCEDGSSFNVQKNVFHSPNKFRINKPLSNFPIFSQVFNCSDTSKMNVRDKCIL